MSGSVQASVITKHDIILNSFCLLVLADQIKLMDWFAGVFIIDTGTTSILRP